MKFIILLTYFISFLSIADSNNVINSRTLLISNKKHSEYLNTSFQNFIVEIQKSDKDIGKIEIIDKYKKKLDSYFYKNSTEMNTKLRISYRSLMHLYLDAFPLTEFFKKSECSSYILKYEEGAGDDVSSYSKMALKTYEILKAICKPI